MCLRTDMGLSRAAVHLAPTARCMYKRDAGSASWSFTMRRAAWQVPCGQGVLHVIHHVGFQ